MTLWRAPQIRLITCLETIIWLCSSGQFFYMIPVPGGTSNHLSIKKTLRRQIGCSIVNFPHNYETRRTHIRHCYLLYFWVKLRCDWMKNHKLYTGICYCSQIYSSYYKQDNKTCSVIKRETICNQYKSPDEHVPLTHTTWDWQLVLFIFQDVNILSSLTNMATVKIQFQFNWRFVLYALCGTCHICRLVPLIKTRDLLGFTVQDPWPWWVQNIDRSELWASD